MNAFVILGIILWVYLLWVFERGKLRFFKFLLGSVGLFIFMMIIVQPIVTEPLAKLVAACSGIVGDVTGLFKSYYDYGLLFINNKSGAISLYIDYECSGVIEMMAFSSLLCFFPVYKWSEKIIINFISLFCILISNVIRIVVICTTVYFCGVKSFYLAHTILGRIVFYGLTIILYYYVFTKAQIIRQKVGRFNYERNV